MLYVISNDVNYIICYIVSDVSKPWTAEEQKVLYIYIYNYNNYGCNNKPYVIIIAAGDGPKDTPSLHP